MKGIVLGIKHKSGVFTDKASGKEIAYDNYYFICGCEINPKVGSGWELAIDDEVKMKVSAKNIPDVIGVASEKDIYALVNCPVEISINKYGRYDYIRPL